MEDTLLQIAERVKALRDICGFEIEEVAEQAEVPVEKYLRYENGEKEFPISVLLRLSAMFGVDPAVLLTGSAKKLRFSNLSSVATDDRKGAACAVEYLLRAGHSDIAVLGGHRQLSGTSHDRHAGCLDAYERSGLVFREEQYYTCRFSYRSGYETMQRVLGSGQPVSAVFAMADVIAVGAIRAIRERGLRIPEDISVMGYDSLELCDYLMPKLSSVAQPARVIAQKGAEILLDCIENHGMARHVTVPFSLDCRESVLVRE